MKKKIFLCIAMAAVLLAIFTITVFADNPLVVPADIRQNGTPVSGDELAYNVSSGRITGNNIVTMGNTNYGETHPVFYNGTAFDLGVYVGLRYPDYGKVAFSVRAQYSNAASSTSEGYMPAYEVRAEVTVDNGNRYNLTVWEGDAIVESVFIPQTRIYGFGVLCWNTGNNLFFRIDTFGSSPSGGEDYFQSDIHMRTVSTVAEASSLVSFAVGDSFQTSAYPMGMKYTAYDRSDWLNSVYNYSDLKRESDLYQQEFQTLAGLMLNDSYLKGYSNGEENGFEDGYDDGYSQGRLDYANEYKDEVSKQYQIGYDLGYLDGKDAGILVGEGRGHSLVNAVDRVGDVIVDSFQTFAANGTLFGWKLSEIIATGLSVILIFWFLRKVF